MLVLVANLGSTSFKYKLFDVGASGERVLGRGQADRIGQDESSWSVTVGGRTVEGAARLADHGQAIDLHLKQLESEGVIERMADVQAIGFKAVHGGPIRGAVLVDEGVIETMQAFADVAPAHNPPYIAAMKAFAARLPGVKQVAAFETGFHQTIPKARQVYGIPHEWTEELGIRRYGFHGASHRYIAVRMAEIEPKARRVISLHLGGSCSVCAIEGGKSVYNSFGMTAQTGVFHHNRVGDFDAFALLKLIKSGIDLETIFKRLGKEGGLLGLSGVSGDLRDVERAAAGGDERAKLAVQAFVESCRHHVGVSLMALGGVDAMVFTGGIGQHSVAVRRGVCEGMKFAGIELDGAKNEAAGGDAEQRIDQAGGGAPVWVLPTNEELIVARQTVEVLERERGEMTGDTRERAGHR